MTCLPPVQFGNRARRRSCLALVCAGIVLFATATAWMNWVRYASLRSTWPYDLGAFHSQAFNQALGRDVAYVLIGSWFARGDHEGPSVYRSNHFSPLRLVVLPQVYRLYPRMVTLMALQGLLVGVGALGLYGLAVDHGGSRGLGLLLAATYLAHPAILHVAFNDYRDIALGMGPALLALWAHATGRGGAFVLAALVMLAARSEYALLLAAFGLINLRVSPAGSRWWPFLLLPVSLAAAWAALSHAYYLYFYGVSWPLVGFSAQRPLIEVLVTLGERLLPFFRTMLVPAVVGLGAPEAFAAALPFVALANGVLWPGFPHHHLQHLSPAMVAVFWAYAVTLVRLWRGPLRSAARRRLAAGVSLLAVAALSFAHFAWSALQAYPPSHVDRFARLGWWADTLPPDATVLVPLSLMARFSHHTRLVSYDELPLGPGTTPEEGRAALLKVLGLSDLVVAEWGSGLEPLVQATGRFHQERVGRYWVFWRRPGASQPARADEALQRALHWERLPPLRRRGATILVGS